MPASGLVHGTCSGGPHQQAIRPTGLLNAEVTLGVPMSSLRLTIFLLIIISCNAATHPMEFTHQIRIKGSRLQVDLLYTTMTATFRPMLAQRLTTLLPSRTETRLVYDRSSPLHLINLDSILSSCSFLKCPRLDSPAFCSSRAQHSKMALGQTPSEIELLYDHAISTGLIIVRVV